MGINRYPGYPDIPLSFARSDAIAFRDWLIAADGGELPKENVRVVAASESEESKFSTGGDARPRRDEINRALAAVNREARTKAVKPADREHTRLYIYLSGHGIAPPGGESALLMANAEDDLLGEYVEVSRYANWYVACGYFREVVIFADCCRQQLPGVPPANAPGLTECSEPAGQTLRFLGYATGLGELAAEAGGALNPDNGRGFFTRALLAGLRGAARDDNGSVTSSGLATYVRKSVEELTRKTPVQQRVQVVGDLALPIVFRQAAPPRPMRKVRLRLPAGHAGQVQLLAGDLSVVGTWDPGSGDWSAELTEGLYQVAPAGPAMPNPFAAEGRFSVVGGDREVQL